MKYSVACMEILENTQELPKQLLTGKKFLAKIANLVREWVMSCEKIFKQSRIDRSFTRPPPQNPNEHITAAEDAMQIDLVPELPAFVGYEGIVTAMDVISLYLFAYWTSNQEAKTIPKVIINIMTKHALLANNSHLRSRYRLYVSPK